MSSKEKNSRYRSKIKIRKHISGTADRPRMTVTRSLTQIYVQLIDDVTGKTLVSASSLSKDAAEELKSTKGKVEVSKVVGKLAAKKALENNITSVVFDRNGYRYHGRIKAVAEGAREAGLKF
ncbi:MAG TPA: 50S ribosomal protein L18 [Ignavibacteriales bacterium]|nr:50S ribosomal protein L18 [Ignavibacteriales bacterium]